MKGMEKNTSISEDDPLMVPIEELVRTLRCDGRTPAEISYALVAAGFGLAMQTAPSAEHAIYLVSGALCTKSREHVEQKRARGEENPEKVVCDEEVELTRATPISDAVN